MFRSRLALLALLLSPFASISPAEAHGSHGGGGESLEAGEFDFTPIITIEGHGGFDTNLEGDPKHYAIDGMFGGVFEWGLANGGSFAIEAAIGPALVGEKQNTFTARFISMITAMIMKKNMTIMIMRKIMTTKKIMAIMIMRKIMMITKTIMMIMTTKKIMAIMITKTIMMITKDMTTVMTTATTQTSSAPISRASFRPVMHRMTA